MILITVFFLKKDKIKKIIIPNTNTGNIVTYKKFFALDTFKEDKTYDYFIVCDSEITIIPENFNQENILDKSNKIFKNKIIYAGEVKDSTNINIIKTSCSLVTDGDILEKLTKNYSLFFWWSDLPVYKREHLTHFFNVIKYDSLNWFQFDHTIYLSYLILHHDFRIENITPLINVNFSLESYNTTDINNLKILKSLNYGFSFLTEPLYYNHIDFLKNEGTFLLYHLDRHVVPDLKSDLVPDLKSDLVPDLKSDLVPALKSDLVPVLKSDLVPPLKSDLVHVLKSDLVPVLKSDLHNNDNIFFIIFVQIIILLLIFYLFHKRNHILLYLRLWIR
jgi:hypothetical protein